MPISVTEFGIVTDVNPEQSQNASSPIVLTVLGIVTDANFEHPKNA